MVSVCLANIKPIFSGAVWKLHRRFVGQTFSYNAIYGNLPIFNKHIYKFLGRLRAEVGAADFDVRLLINRVTLDMFLESTLGTDLTENEKQLFGYALTEYVCAHGLRFV